MFKEKILVADDEQSMREFLDIMLKRRVQGVTGLPGEEF
jgi:DNA-binding NtrC family response regulator